VVQPQHPNQAPAGRRRRPVGAVRTTAALAVLSRLAMTPAGAITSATLVQACTLIGAMLGAEEAYVVKTGDPHFVRVDAPGDPRAYEVKQKGYFLIWRELASNPEVAGGLFNVVERRVADPSLLRGRAAATHLAMLLPSDESSSELLLVRGPWPAGLSRGQVDFITAARPMLAYLVGTLLDTRRRERQREQLHSFGAVAAALTRGQELEAALPAIATAVARASGFDWATITLVDERIEQITARAINNARHSDTATANLSREGEANLEDALRAARAFRGRAQPQLFSNLLDDSSAARTAMRRFLERAHLLSTATFPLYSGQRLLGTLNFSDSTVHGFAAREVDFLTLLGEQVVHALEWLQLNQELREANAALARAASHDALTGLPNRMLFLDRLDQTLARAQRCADAVAVLFIDLDDFKAVNDRFGHETGDRLLRVVAERLQRTLRTGDTAARLGGDEFTVVLGDVTGEEQAQQVAERLRRALQQPVELAGQCLLPRASIGVACASAASANAEALLRRADQAMYEAKAQAKARLIDPAA